VPHPRLCRPPAPHQEDRAALDSNLSNALIESANTKIRLITRMAVGFHSPEPALVALAMLSLGAHPPAFPGRPNRQMRQESRRCPQIHRTDAAPPPPPSTCVPPSPKSVVSAMCGVLIGSVPNGQRSGAYPTAGAGAVGLDRRQDSSGRSGRTDSGSTLIDPSSYTYTACMISLWLLLSQMIDDQPLPGFS
jgi:hypothetical protein